VVRSAGVRAKTWPSCLRLAWSRVRVVLPARDKSLPTVVACIGAMLRCFGDACTESQREDAHAGPHRAHRHASPKMVAVGRHDGLNVCQLCAGGPAVEGWQWASRAYRRRRPGAHRSQSAARLLEQSTDGWRPRLRTRRSRKFTFSSSLLPILIAISGPAPGFRSGRAPQAASSRLSRNEQPSFACF
jgi:hypothetical protein